MTEEEILESVAEALDAEFQCNRTEILPSIQLARVAIDAYKYCFEEVGEEWRFLRPNGKWSAWMDGNSNRFATFEPDGTYENRSIFAMKDKND